MKVERTSGSGADIVLSSSSIRAGVLGKMPTGTLTDRTFVLFVEDKPIIANTVVPIITIRNKGTFQGLQNNVRIRYGTVDLLVDGTKDVKWFVYKNSTLTGSAFTPLDVNESVTEVDRGATAMTGGTLIGGALLQKSNEARINLFSGDVIIPAYPNETITLACKSAGATTANVFLRVIEEF